MVETADRSKESMGESHPHNQPDAGGDKCPRDAVEAAGSAAVRKPSLVVNAVSGWVGFAATVVAGFLLTPYVITRLGKSGYGVWCLVGSVIGYYGLLDLGVSAAVRRYVARYAARGDHDALNETVGTAVTVFAIAGVAMLVFSIIAGGALASFFGVTGAEAVEFHRIVIFLGAAAGFNIVGQVYRATITAHEHFVARNCVTIAVTAIRAGLTVWTLMMGWGLLGVAASCMVVDMIRLVCDLCLVKWLTPHVITRPGRWRWRRVRPLLTYGLTMTVIVGAGIVQVQTASAILAKVVSLEAVAVYAIAALLMRHFSNLIHAGMGVLGPRFAGLDGANDTVAIRRLVLKGLWVSTILSCSVGLGMLILGDRFLHLWVGSRFTPAEFSTAVTVLMILTVYYALGLSQAPATTALYAMNRHRVYAGVMLVEAAVNVTLSIILAGRMGTVGVAVGALISMVVVRMVTQPVYVSRVVGLSLRQYCLPIAGPTAAAAAIWVLWRHVLWPHVPPQGYMGLITGGLCITLTYLMLLAAVAAVVDIARGRPVRLAGPFVSTESSV